MLAKSLALAPRNFAPSAWPLPAPKTPYLVNNVALTLHHKGLKENERTTEDRRDGAAVPGSDIGQKPKERREARWLFGDFVDGP